MAVTEMAAYKSAYDQARLIGPDGAPPMWAQMASLLPMILGVAINIGLFATLRRMVTNRELRLLLRLQALADGALCMSSLWCFSGIPAGNSTGRRLPASLDTAICYVWHTGFAYWLVAGTSNLLVTLTTLNRVARVTTIAQQRHNRRITAATIVAGVVGEAIVIALVALVTCGNVRGVTTTTPNNNCVLMIDNNWTTTYVITTYVLVSNLLLPILTALGGVTLACRLSNFNSSSSTIMPGKIDRDNVVVTRAIAVNAALYLALHAAYNAASLAFVLGIVADSDGFQAFVWASKYLLTIGSFARPAACWAMLNRPATTSVDVGMATRKSHLSVAEQNTVIKCQLTHH